MKTTLRLRSWFGNVWDNLFGFEQPDSRGQRIFRRVFEAFIGAATIWLAFYWGEYTLRIGDVVLELGLARYLDITFMHGNMLPIWNAWLITAGILLGFLRVERWVPGGRWVYMVTFVLLLFQYAARFTLGEIPHSSNLVGMGLLGFALAKLLYTDAKERGRFALGFSYFFIGLGYTSAAVSKLVARGLTWPDGRHLWMWINEKAMDEMARSGSVELNGLQQLAMEYWWVATAFLAFGLLTEACAWLIWFRKTRYLTLWAVMGLHIGIWMVMDILFKLSVYEILLLGLPWAFWIDRIWPEKENRLGSGASR